MNAREAWSDAQIAAIRKIYRRNGALSEAIAALGETTLSAEAIRARLIKLGMRFYARPTAHQGNSKSISVE